MAGLSSAGWLEPLVAAVAAADARAATGFFAPDGTLTILRRDGDLVAAGPMQIESLWTRLFAAVTEIDYRAHRRYLSDAVATEEATVAGRHVGDLLGFPGTGRRIEVDLRLNASIATDGRVQALVVGVDVPSLLQRLGAASAEGAASALVADLRTHDDDGVKVIEASAAPPPPPPPSDEQPQDAPPPARSARGRRPRRPILVPVLGAAVFTAAVGVVLASAHRGASSPTAAGVTVPSAAPSATMSSTPSAVPVIASIRPNAHPTVQPGHQVVLSTDVLFALDSAQLSSHARSALSGLAARIRGARVHGTIQINGYTDALGSSSYDLNLSRARALAVANALAPLLAGEQVRLTPQGFGKADPVAPNGTATGRARNRRVAIVLPLA